MSSNFKSHCAATDKEEDRRERQDRTVWKVRWKNGVEREEEGGVMCRGKEISVSAKVFIKILRQMISVSFS